MFVGSVLWLCFHLTRIVFFLYSRCRVTTTSGPLRRQAETTTERKTDTPTFCHVSEAQSSAADDVNITFTSGVVLITECKGKVMLAFLFCRWSFQSGVKSSWWTSVFRLHKCLLHRRKSQISVTHFKRVWLNDLTIFDTVSFLRVLKRGTSSSQLKVNAHLNFIY